jgi:hypothetical protein
VKYYPAGDIAQPAPGTSSATGPPASGYGIFRYATNSLRTHGRYVALIVDAPRPYIFCDEIEVLAGDRSWLGEPLSGEPTTNLTSYFGSAHVATSIRLRLATDLADARAALASSAAGASLRADLAYRLDMIESEIAAGVPAPPASFVAVLPINDLETRIFQVQGAIAQANGMPALTAWAADPWAFVRPTDKPQPFGPEIVAPIAMNGETRSGAISVSNSTEQPLTLALRITHEDGSLPPDLGAYEVLWTDTRELIPVADAL